MKRVITSLSLLLLLLCGAYAQDISQYEYWTDDDYASRSVVNSSGESISLDVSTASLSAGIHFLNFRAKRSDEVWGNFYRYLYYIPTTPNSVNAGNSKVEYWLDDDLTSVKSEAAGNGNLMLSVDINALKPGVHYFNCTPISSTGERGNSERYLFYVPLPQDQTSVSPVKGYEYWLDDNYAEKAVNNSGSNGTLSISLDGLTSGVHYFNCRAYNERGEYGCPVRKMFYIPQTKVNNNASIASAEYWLDDDFAKKVSLSGNNVQQTLSIDISHLGSGVHYFNYRAKDNEGVWGNITRQMFYIAHQAKSVGSELMDYECWFDDDISNKTTGKAILANYVISMDISGLQEGKHTFNFRAKNVLDQWTDIFTETFTVSFDLAAPATVAAKDTVIYYGDEIPQFEYSVTEGRLIGKPQLTTTATKESPVGTYPIEIASGTIENTNVTCINGTLTIKKAPLTIKAGTYTKKQGEDNPDFTLNYEGFKNNETEDVLTQRPIVRCVATDSSAPGEYAVTISGADAQNYDISYVDGKLIVMDADAVVIMAKNYIREYADDNPTFEYEVSGAPLDGIPEIICEATSTSPAGTYDIVVKTGTVKNYNVTYVKGTLTITKAPLTIKAGTYTKKQGEVNPDFTLSYEGFKNNETEDVLTIMPSVSCDAMTNSAPGEYAVVVNGAEASNYSINYVNGRLIVTQADAIVIMAKNYSREYGDENPVFEYEVSGATLDGTPEIICEATNSSAVGTYSIVVKPGSVGNYNTNYVNGTLTITKAPLRVSVKDVVREQGVENPQFELVYEGWKLQDTESVLLKMPVATTTATKNSPSGEYVITISGGEAQNYALTYQSGRLTVTIPSNIEELMKAGMTFDVYDMSGRKIRHQATTLQDLPKGVYIVGGQKVVLK